VAYEENLDLVIQVFYSVCEELSAERPAVFVSPPKVLRVDGLGGDGFDIKIVGDVKVFKQWEHTGELRKRLKDRFDTEGIEIPYHREVQVPFRGAPLPTTAAQALEASEDKSAPPG
jgi:small-conductance mechanosensitive channel